ncbi:MAG: HD-GYP domain-containing protein [Eubacteriales bacterium]|nr:HD-GYP domain-containing protein [Eubacteriales bacterium]
MEEKTIFIFDADEGMKLSKDVIQEDGHIIVPKGTILDMDIISKISSGHVLEISVYVQPKKALASDTEAAREVSVIESEDTQTYFEKIKNSDEYKHFNDVYMDNVNTIKNNLNDIITSNTPINVTELLRKTSNMLHEYNNSLQLFDMLHCMRQFDDLTYIHCLNVSLIASIIGKWLNYSKEDIDVLTIAGLLHDIGKLLTPQEILTKPGKLTSNEYEIIKNHVNLGYEQLKDQDIDIRIKEACLLHHENCDGSGYPFHLTSSRIPPVAKIISIADVYDAMTAARVYRSSICPFHVIDIMAKDAYSKFDPAYLLPFLKNVVSSYIHNDVKLSNGEIGKVVLINDNAPSRPIIQCSRDKFIDLSKEPGLEITAIL